MILILLTFDPLGTTYENFDYGTLENELPPDTKNTKVWEFSCKVLGCMFDRKDANLQSCFRECGSKIYQLIHR